MNWIDDLVTKVSGKLKESIHIIQILGQILQFDSSAHLLLIAGSKLEPT